MCGVSFGVDGAGREKLCREIVTTFTADGDRYTRRLAVRAVGRERASTAVNAF